AFAATPTVPTPQDSLRNLLIPGGQQCLACHGMKQLTAAFDFSKDPHQARCGSCHDPHGQERPRDADSTCASCHTKWRDIPFHTGAIHRNHVRPSACTACHQPHAARVDASDCTGCHSAMREREDGVEERRPPPMSFDTTAALRTSAVTPSAGPAPPPPREPRGKGDAPVAEDEPPPWRADSFPHARHQRLACITCHDPRSNRKLTFEPGRGCQICHHQDPARNDCATCHRPDSLATPITLPVTVTVAARGPRSRPVAFPHGRHTSVACLECHTTPITLAPRVEAANCTACHDRHAATTVACGSCHAAIPDSAHAPPVDAHRACATCHEVTTVGTLTPTRNLCLTCHAPQRDHKPGLECTTCHLQATPEQYRPALARGAPSR
ncbi:MAG TPA: cytochrome c3 family protein, partial [Gemmatimonadales bacterium]|nr:cytochrome c3 family protein [Gemmatimonadales bacterium]